MFTEHHLYPGSGNGQLLGILQQGDRAYRLSGRIHQDVCFGVGLRIAEDPPTVVLEEAHEVCTIEVERHARAVR